jgi:hypothetical protein
MAQVEQVHGGLSVLLKDTMKQDVFSQAGCF